MCVKLNVQQLCRVSTLLGAWGVAPGWRIFLPVIFASRTNSSVVHVCTKRFTPLHFTSQLLRQILRRRKEKAFSFHGVLTQFVHVAFERVVTLNLGPSIVLTLWTVKIVRYNLKPRLHNAGEIWKRNIHWSFWICGKTGAEKKTTWSSFSKSAVHMSPVSRASLIKVRFLDGSDGRPYRQKQMRFYISPAQCEHGQNSCCSVVKLKID